MIFFSCLFKIIQKSDLYFKKEKEKWRERSAREFLSSYWRILYLFQHWRLNRSSRDGPVLYHQHNRRLVNAKHSRRSWESDSHQQKPAESSALPVFNTQMMTHLSSFILWTGKTHQMIITPLLPCSSTMIFPKCCSKSITMLHLTQYCMETQCYHVKITAILWNFHIPSYSIITIFI